MSGRSRRQGRSGCVFAGAFGAGVAFIGACSSGGIPDTGVAVGGAGGGIQGIGGGQTEPAAGASGVGGGSAGVAGGGGTAGGGIAINCGHPDCDGDGYPEPIDCNDNEKATNPDAYDFVGDGVDNDCDGIFDNPVATCEASPASPPGTPAEFARTMDICPQHAIGKSGAVVDPLLKSAWGKVSGPGLGAQNWTSETKPALQTNIVSSFGKNTPRMGLTMAGLSTGRWGAPKPREEDALDPPAYGLLDACAAIPLQASDCAILSNGSAKGGVSVQDFAELDIWLQVPSNAKGVSFDFSFFTSEFTQFWNAATNDAFFVLASTSTMQSVNIAKQADGTGISVNSGFFQLCPKVPPVGLFADKLPALAKCVGNDGDAGASVFGSITGTGYDGAASSPFDGTATTTDGKRKYLYGGGTGWLTAVLPVTPGEQVMFRFMIMDTFDGLKDSAVLIDRFSWIPVEVAVVEPGVVRPPKLQDAGAGQMAPDPRIRAWRGRPGSRMGAMGSSSWRRLFVTGGGAAILRLAAACGDDGTSSSETPLRCTPEPDKTSCSCDDRSLGQSGTCGQEDVGGYGMCLKNSGVCSCAAIFCVVDDVDCACRFNIAKPTGGSLVSKCAAEYCYATEGACHCTSDSTMKYTGFARVKDCSAREMVNGANATSTGIPWGSRCDGTTLVE